MIIDKIKKIRQFVEEDIWRVRKDATTKRQFWLIRIFRIFVLAIRRFLVDDCQVKASALTYYSLLSVVPVVALAFAIAKGFGFRETLEEQLQQRLVGHEEVVHWVQEFALSYLDNTKGGMIAGVGVVVLLWSVMNILGNIEKSFNDVWDVKTPRSIVRKFSDYISFVLVATVLLMLSSSFMIFITNSIEVFDLGRVATPIITWASPYILIWAVFSIMFLLMPNTKVRIASAIFGGIIAGSLFLGLQFAYITFQVGMSKYNAIYGSFAALPLFLIWMHSSWLVVLLGAELSYAHQNEKSYEFEADTQRISHDYRKLVSLLVVKNVVDAFKSQQPAPSMADLSVDLKLPIRLVSDLLRKLEDAGVLIEVVAFDEEREIGFAPAFDIDQMTVASIIQRLETSGTSDFHFEETEDYQKLRGILDQFGKTQAQLADNRLLRDL
ncbi:YihY/virulence factor BrkB family protein [Geofilum rhodophaeum]|uniref:YihY/virulence factor BrkB family protein n=1 Tax=Geofilum rhodophaeum TaxID=1965019 RepID=UPI001F0B699E|nr:YihY/virulence factor BrkB family protein [Geofilum rhodophaeum]